MNGAREAAFAIGSAEAGAPPRRLAYYEWGEAANPRVALCLHGLSRNARDFDWLAEALASSHRVIALDCAGRGHSDWLSDLALYAQPTYIDDALALLGHLGVAEVDWIGTSMGGMMGITLAAREAAQAKRTIRRLVLNDIGPFLPGRAMDRVGTYVGRAPGFADLEAAYRYQAGVIADWASLTEAQRRHLAQHSVRPREGGGYAIHYDPRIGDYLHQGKVPDLAIWERWDAVGCEVLVLRGATSDILLPETVAEMQRRGPGASVVEFPGVGHTPSLMTGPQIETVVRFLNG